MDKFAHCNGHAKQDQFLTLCPAITLSSPPRIGPHELSKREGYYSKEHLLKNIVVFNTYSGTFVFAEPRTDGDNKRLIVCRLPIGEYYY